MQGTIMNILIIGAGKLGLPLAHQLNSLGHQITTLSKSQKEVAKGITHICQDVHLLTEKSFENQTFDWVYVILTPEERNEFGYTKAYVNSVYPIANALKNHHINRLIYVSSSQVYGENGGESVDDNVTPMPTGDFGKILYAGELLWQAFFKDRLTIIRSSGIISNEHNFLVKKADTLEQITEQHWLNFIIRDDVIDILANLPSYADKLANNNQKLLPSYIISSQTVIRHEMLNHIRQRKNLPIIEVPDNLPITGKKLIASRLQDLLKMQNMVLGELLL